MHRLTKTRISQAHYSFNFIFLGPAEFDEEKISIASATGPASDISAGSSNSNEVKATVLLGGAAGTGSGTPALATSGAASASANNSTGRKTSRLSLHGLNMASSMSSLIKQPIEKSGLIMKNEFQFHEKKMKSSGSGSSSSSFRNSKANSRSLLNLFSAYNNTTTNQYHQQSNSLNRQGKKDNHFHEKKLVYSIMVGKKILKSLGQSIRQMNQLSISRSTLFFGIFSIFEVKIFNIYGKYLRKHL